MTPEITLPPLETTIPGYRTLPPELQTLIERLSAPFPLAELRVRPGQTRRDGTAAQALPYAEWWGSYQPRLDATLGRANWRIRLTPWGSDSIIARMSVFDGLIERDSTGSSKEAFEGGQDAEAQAMKRVCARAVGLGLYLYFLPEVWGKGERDGRRFCFADGEAERCLHETYRRAGLSATPHPGVTLAPVVHAEANAPTTSPAVSSAAARPHPTADQSAPAPTRLHTARRVLAHAEQQVGVRPDAGRRLDTPTTTVSSRLVTSPGAASERQRAAIVRLLVQVRRDGQQPATLNRIGQEQAEIAGLAAITTAAALPATLSSPQASALITALQGRLA